MLDAGTALPHRRLWSCWSNTERHWCGAVRRHKQCVRNDGRLHALYQGLCRATGSMDAVFCEFNLDTEQVIEIPRAKAFTCHLPQGIDPEYWQLQGSTVTCLKQPNADTSFAPASAFSS